MECKQERTVAPMYSCLWHKITAAAVSLLIYTSLYLHMQGEYWSLPLVTEDEYFIIVTSDVEDKNISTIYLPEYWRFPLYCRCIYEWAGRRHAQCLLNREIIIKLLLSDLSSLS